MRPISNGTSTAGAAIGAAASDGNTSCGKTAGLSGLRSRRSEHSYCLRRGLRDNSCDGYSSKRDGFVSGVSSEAAELAQRDRFIPLRKSDLIDGLVNAGHLDEAGQARFRQFARQLGALFHYQYFEQ